MKLVNIFLICALEGFKFYKINVSKTPTLGALYLEINNITGAVELIYTCYRS